MLSVTHNHHTHVGAAIELVKDSIVVEDYTRALAAMSMLAKMAALGVGDDLPVEAKTVTEALSKIQRKVEDFNAEQRTNVLKFDDVQDGQRRALYATRRRLLLADGDEASSTFTRWVADSIIATARSVDREKVDDPDALLASRLAQVFGKTPALDASALRDGDAEAVAANPAVTARAGGLGRPMRDSTRYLTQKNNGRAKIWPATPSREALRAHSRAPR